MDGGKVNRTSLNIYFLKAQTDCPVETMLLRTKVNFRSAIRQNFSLKDIRTSRVCVALKPIWSYSTLINIKHR